MTDYKDYGWSDSEFTCAHKLFMKPIMKMLPLNGFPILDIGCGNGSLANYLIKMGYNVFGADASVSGIDIANKVNPGRFFIHDFSNDNLPVELRKIQFKTIISTEVVEHLYNPRKYISLCKAILNNSGGGTLIISTPYHGYWKNLALAICGAMDRHFTALWDGGHIKFWSYQTLNKLLQEQGFKIVAFKGCGRLPFLWKTMVIRSLLEG